MLFSKKDKSISMTMPKKQVLYGVEIHKLPVAKYIEVLNTAENLPSILLNDIYPDVQNFAGLISKLGKMDRDSVLELLGKMLTTVPTEFCKIISGLLDIPIERLLDAKCDNPLSLNELLEIILAFIEINDMSDFFVSVRRLKVKLSALKQTNTGFSVGSQ
ncbi:MAG: hypothetical protein PUG48_03605 [Clostridia bacterium]|nr:hypothetical protein [Clostridia bacterium]